MKAAPEQDGRLRALREMRATRRRRFVGQIEVMELVYRVYVAAIFGAIALAVVSGAVHDAAIGPGEVADIAAKGPALLGLAVAVAALAGLRSGARGGPLAIEDAEVQYVLLAPIERRLTLRPVALGQLRTALLAGAVLGVVAGNFAFRRLPGSAPEWFACLALFGALLPLCALVAALLACGRRLRPRPATAIGLLIVLWSLADVVLGVTTSPATMLGLLATLPLQHGARELLAALGVAVALGAGWLGLRRLGGISLEAARRRATLAAEMRFSASVQDVRTVILLRRQLASEKPRRRPWLGLRAPRLARRPVWRRGWQSLLRWPAARLVRVLLAGAAAGAVAVAGWSEATPLLVLPGPILFVAALDLVEPLAQEADHPLRRDLLPVEAKALIYRHLLAPASAMVLMVLLGTLTAMALGAPGAAAEVGLAMAAPTAFALLCCAALSATYDPYANLLVPQMGLFQSAVPILAATIAVGLPLLIARQVAENGHSPFGAVLSVELTVAIGAGALALWLGKRVTGQAEVAP
jgi:hypothetical protein